MRYALLQIGNGMKAPSAPFALVEFETLEGLPEQIAPRPYRASGWFYFRGTHILTDQKSGQKEIRFRVSGVVLGDAQKRVRWKRNEPPPHLEVVEIPDSLALAFPVLYARLKKERAEAQAQP